MRQEFMPQQPEVRRLPEKTQREQNQLFVSAAKRDFGWQSDLEGIMLGIEEGIIVREAHARADHIDAGNIVRDELTDMLPERRVWMVTESKFWEFRSEVEVNEATGQSVIRYYRVILDVEKNIGVADRFHTLRRSPEVVYELRFQADSKTIQDVREELADFRQQEAERETQEQALDDFLSRNKAQKLTKIDLENMSDVDKKVLSRQMWLSVLQQGGSLVIKDEDHEWQIVVCEKGAIDGEERLMGIYTFPKRHGN